MMTWKLPVFAALASLMATAARCQNMGHHEPIVEGSLSLGGKAYRAVCNCNDGAGERVAGGATPVCNPSKVRVHQSHTSSQGMLQSEVQRQYAQPSNLEFASVANHHFSCLDDRNNEPSLSTPGGDLGEFFLAIAVSQSEGNSFDEKKISEILSQYVGTLSHGRQFAHCTDDMAIGHLKKQLNVEGLDIVQAAPAAQEDIKAALSNPENVGDVHFRTIIAHPSWYHVNQELATDTLKAFYNNLWDSRGGNQDKMLLQVFPGHHNASAFLEVVTSSACDSAEIAPLMQSKAGSTGAYLNHMTAVSQRRRELATFFYENGYTSLSPDQFQTRMDHRGYEGLETTGARVAGDLPFYRIEVV